MFRVVLLTLLFFSCTCLTQAATKENPVPDIAFSLSTSNPVPSESEFVLREGNKTVLVEQEQQNADTSARTKSDLKPMALLESSAVPIVHARDQLILSFTNPIDEEKFSENLVTISPTISNPKIEIAENQLRISGKMEQSKHYAVVVSDQLMDVYGQRALKAGKIEFDVTPYSPIINVPPGQEILRPGLPPVFRVFALNKSVRVRVWKPTPELQARQKLTERTLLDKLLEYPPTIDKKFECSVDDEVHEFKVNLENPISKGDSEFIVVVNPLGPIPSMLNKNVIWIQCTDVELLTKFSEGSVTISSVSLVTGKPLPNTLLTIPAPSNRKYLTNGHGTVVIPLSNLHGSVNVVASVPGHHKREQTITVPTFSVSASINQRDLESSPEWLFLTDRSDYEPGDTVFYKGYARRNYKNGSLDAVTDRALQFLTVELTLASGNQTLFKTHLKPDSFGTISGSFDIPNTTPECELQILLKTSKEDLWHSASNIHVVHRKNPEYQLAIIKDDRDSDLSKTSDRNVTVSMRATTASGQKLENAIVNWRVFVKPTSVNPKGWEGFSFCDGSQPSFCKKEISTGTDQLGRSSISIEIDKNPNHNPLLIDCTAKITDKKGCEFFDRVRFVRDAPDRYVGIKPTRNIVNRGEPIEFKSVVCDANGNTFPSNATTLELFRTRTQQGRIIRQRRLQSRKVDSTGIPYASSFAPQEAGRYAITASLTDRSGRAVSSLSYITVTDQASVGDTHTSGQYPELKPDKTLYKMGESAQVTLCSPYAHTTGFLSISQGTASSQKRFEFDGSEKLFEIPVRKSISETISLEANLIGPVNDEHLERQTACRTLAISHVHRPKVSIYTQAASKANPESQQVFVTIRNSEGKPVKGAQLFLMVVENYIGTGNGFRADQISEFSTRFATHGTSSQRYWELPSARSISKQMIGRAGSEWAYFGVKPESHYTHCVPIPHFGVSIGDTPNSMLPPKSACPMFEPELISDHKGSASAVCKLSPLIPCYKIIAIARHKDYDYGTATKMIGPFGNTLEATNSLGLLRNKKTPFPELF